MVAETGFAKKDKVSVGVARQYCGTLGKVANCQVDVFAAWASRQGYALVDKRLFLLEP
jgi:SRSO17 transposase